MSELKTKRELQMYKNDSYVGTLTRTNEGCDLNFDEAYRESIRIPNLTYNISIEKPVLKFKGVGLPPYFAGLLPEGLRLKALVRRLKTSEDDMFSLLVASGMDPVGDIHFKNFLPEVNQEDEAVPEDFGQLRKLLKSGENPGQNSLAGVQDKLSADRISIPLSSKKKGRSYILKLESLEFPDGVINEYVCLKIAKACGLQVNTAEIVHDAQGVSALLVERFDRKWNSRKKTWHRFHQEDACQFLNRYPADKYHLSMQEIAVGISRFASAPEIEILNLLRLKAFSYLIGNGDLHGKNISLLEIEGASQLSPCYDILCTLLYGDQKMALLMDGKNQNLKTQNFLEFGTRHGIPAKATMSMIKDLVRKFQIHKDQIFKVPLAEKKKAFLNQTFAERIQHLSV